MQQKLEIIVKNNKYGLINQQQEIIVPCIYDDIYWVGREYYDGIEIEENEEYLREYYYLAQFDAYLTESWIEMSDDWFAFKLDGLWGFVDNSFKSITDFIYDDIHSMTEEQCLVMKNNKHGIIAKNGEEIIPVIYESLYYYIKNIIVAVYEGKVGGITYDGREIIPFIYDGICYLIDEYGLVSKEYMLIQQGNCYGVIDEHFNEILPIIYHKVSILGDYYEANYLLVELNHQKGVFNLKGEVVIPLNNYDSIESFDDRKGYFWVEISNQKAIINFGGEFIVPLGDWCQINSILNGFIVKDKKQVYILMPNKKLVYEDLFILENDRLKVKQGNKFGVINEQGDIIIPILYDNIDIANQKNDDGGIKSSFIVATLNQKIGYFNRQGQLIHKFMDIKEKEATNKTASATAYLNTEIIFMIYFIAFVLAGVVLAYLNR